MISTVIVPTTGSDSVVAAIKSVISQKAKSLCYLVVDGEQFSEKVFSILKNNGLSKHSQLKVCVLPINVGGGGFYGHRVYSAFPHLINTPYVCFLDQDCWMDNNHVESMVNIIESNSLDWGYSLRKIVNKDGNFLCNDDCESLGKWTPYVSYNHIDTNCYCIKTDIAIRICQIFHGGWGQDRIFYQGLSHHFPKFDCSGEYSLNYRLEGNVDSVTPEFFSVGNEAVNKIFNKFPWISNKRDVV